MIYLTSDACLTHEWQDTSPLPSKSIQQPGELSLLLEICQNHGDYKQVLEYLSTEQLGPSSPIAKAAWRFTRQKLEAMHELGLWRDIFDECAMLLVQARANNEGGAIVNAWGGDWLVWKLYLQASRATEFSQYATSPRPLDPRMVTFWNESAS